MPVDNASTTPDDLARAKARRSVFAFAVVLFFAVTVAALVLDRPLWEALKAGLGTALAGLTAWWTRHFISRRIDSLGFFFIVCGGTFHFTHPGSLIGQAEFVRGLITGVIVGVMAGLWDRWTAWRRPRRMARRKA